MELFIARQSRKKLWTLPMVGRTQEFPDGGANPKGGCANQLFGQIFTKNCIKMKEIWPRIRPPLAP